MTDNHLAMSLCRDGGVLSIAQMSAADAGAVAAGVAGQRLMEHAGGAVADAIMARFAPAPVTVLCGPGNNGGDGFVVARKLAHAGWTVRVALLGERQRLKGDAAGAGLVVDGLFGAGLARPLEGVARTIVETLAASRLPVVAIDLPSGLDGDTGAVLGAAAPARLTVTFHRPKIGHLLLPGRTLLGELVVSDIGIPVEVDRTLDIRLWANAPRLWRADIPHRTASSHKYTAGHALVLGGGASSSGAARMAARAALRVGAGAVTVLCPEDALAVYAAQLTAIMVAPFADEAAFAQQLADPRRTAILLGPGAGVGAALRGRVAQALGSDKACVLDADALTSFAEQPADLFAQIEGPCLMTPHEGEFARLFDLEGDKLSRARAAARQSGAIVLIKGADTVVAAPDGRAVIQPHAPSALATAGSGDVLAGTALGLAAQGMPLFEAAAAAVWLHAAAAQGGVGLSAEDLSEALPAVMRAHPAFGQASPSGMSG
jgi:NAD(P)H-hydrate epimerase